MEQKKEINLEDTKKQLEFLGHKVFWFHVFKPKINDTSQKGDLYSVFCTQEKVIGLCKHFNGKGIICVALNERESHKQKKEDVKRVTTLFFDIDVKKSRKQGFVSTKEDHTHAIAKATSEIKPHLESKGFSIDLIIDSGNGCQMFSKVDIDISTPEKREAFLSRVKQLEEDLRIYNDSIIEVDFVTKDINRRVKLAGTINKKDTHQTEDRVSEILYLNKNIDIERNKQAFEKSLVLNNNIITQTRKETEQPKLKDTMLFSIIEKDFSINQLYNNKETDKFKSRSEAELSLVTKLLLRGVTFFEDIDKIMQSSKIGKWTEANHQYRKTTFEKAYQRYDKDKEYITKGFALQTDGLYNIKNFNNSTEVVIMPNGEIYEHLKEITNNTNYSAEKLFSLYSGSIGQGNKPIIIKSKYKLDVGDNKLYLSIMDKEELRSTLWYMKQEGLYSVCKSLGVSTTIDKKGGYRDKKEIVNELLTFETSFFKPMLPIDKKELEKAGNPYEIVSKILKNGLDKDWNIDYLSIADIPEVNPKLIQAKNYQKFAPHKIIITNSKVGKSFNSLMVTGESALERPSEAGLLGFADAKGKNYGKLHLRTKQTYIEEVQEEKGEELFGKCHTYMEVGETQIARGIGINIYGYSGITFQGNPKLKEEFNEETLESYLIIKEFREFLNIISKNIKPLSSRIGVTLFDKELEKVTGKPSSNDIIDKGHKIIKSYAEGYKDEFTSLFTNKEVIEFLNSDYEEDYKKSVRSIINQNNDRVIKEYFEGQLEAFRHTRGIALRLGWIEKGLQSLFETGEVNIKELLDCSQDHFEILKKRNIRSFTNIISGYNSEFFKELTRSNIEHIKPDYVKFCTYTLFEKILDNYDPQNRIIPLQEIEEYYKEVKNKLEIEDNHVYRSYSKLTKAMNKFQKGSFSSLLCDFSLDYDKTNSCFVILDSKKIIEIAKEYENLFTTNTTITTDNNTNTKNKLTQLPQLTQNKEKKVKSVVNVVCGNDFSQNLRKKYVTLMNILSGYDFHLEDNFLHFKKEHFETLPPEQRKLIEMDTDIHHKKAGYISIDKRWIEEGVVGE
jgi:hypothetical protein